MCTNIGVQVRYFDKWLDRFVTNHHDIIAVASWRRGLLYTGRCYYHWGHFESKSPKSDHRFALFDPPKMGNLMTPVSLDLIYPSQYHPKTLQAAFGATKLDDISAKGSSGNHPYFQPCFSWLNHDMLPSHKNKHSKLEIIPFCPNRKYTPKN